MKVVARFERRSLATALVLAGAMAFAGTVGAQYSQDQAKPSSSGSQLTNQATPDPHQEAKSSATPSQATATASTTPSQANATTSTTPSQANATSQASAMTSPSSATTQALMSEKPIIPSKAEMPDAAFKKLDAAGKGYVSKEDTKGLSGFDRSFELADANHDGKLDASEFNKAWESFTGRKS